MTDERLDEETERVIEDFGDEACVKGQIFIQAFGSRAEQLVENKNAVQRTTAARIALRSRIRTLIEEARKEAEEREAGWRAIVKKLGGAVYVPVPADEIKANG